MIECFRIRKLNVNAAITLNYVLYTQGVTIWHMSATNVEAEETRQDKATDSRLMNRCVTLWIVPNFLNTLNTIKSTNSYFETHGRVLNQGLIRVVYGGVLLLLENMHNRMRFPHFPDYLPCKSRTGLSRT